MRRRSLADSRRRPAPAGKLNPRLAGEWAGGPLDTWFGAELDGLLAHRSAAETRLVDILDRILDKGIVLDVSSREAAAVSFGLISVEGHVVVTSLETTYPGSWGWGPVPQEPEPGKQRKPLAA